MDLELKGKSVVVTGGGSNIGRAIVLGFAEEGANITIGDIDVVQAGKVAELALKVGFLRQDRQPSRGHLPADGQGPLPGPCSHHVERGCALGHWWG